MIEKLSVFSSSFSMFLKLKMYYFHKKICTDSFFEMFDTFKEFGALLQLELIDSRNGSEVDLFTKPLL